MSKVNTFCCSGIKSTVCPTNHPIVMANGTCCDSQFKINNPTLDPDCDGNYISLESNQICCPNSIGCPSKLCKSYTPKGYNMNNHKGLVSFVTCYDLDGNWLTWEHWTNCTTRCSTRTRTRICTEPETAGIAVCPSNGPGSETKPCPCLGLPEPVIRMSYLKSLIHS